MWGRYETQHCRVVSLAGGVIRDGYAVYVHCLFTLSAPSSTPSYTVTHVPLIPPLCPFMQSLLDSSDLPTPLQSPWTSPCPS